MPVARRTTSATAFGSGPDVSAVTTGIPTAEVAAASATDDNWPHTKRVMPWMLAGFLVLLFLIPFDSITFKLHLPANLTPDRLFLIAMVGVLIFKAATEGPSRKRYRRMTPVERAVLVFVGVSLLSIVLNIDRIYRLNELTLVEKSLSQLLAYVVFFFIVVATVRGAELRAFARLILVLACLTAVGTIYQARSGVDVFYLWSSKLLSPIATITPSLNLGTGPTQHGLALATMLTMALPFAVLPLLESKRNRQRFLYLVVIGLILAADLSTQEKTAVLAPLAVAVVLVAYKRQLLRWTPIALIALIPVIHFAAPGTLGGVSNIIPGASNGDYTDGRAGDYPAVAPDILSNLVIGRGYGSLDVQNWRWYRILDNQYLDELFTVGVVGLLAYLAVILTALTTAHGVIKRGGVRAPPALAAAAACAAYGLVSATFDAFGYPQSVYSFVFAAGLIAIVAGERTGAKTHPRISLVDLVTLRRKWVRVVPDPSTAQPQLQPSATPGSSS